MPSRVLTDKVTWSVDRRRHLIRCASFVRRNPIFRDLFGAVLIFMLFTGIFADYMAP